MYAEYKFNLEKNVDVMLTHNVEKKFFTQKSKNKIPET